MKKSLVSRALKLAVVIVPPNGEITFKIVRTKDESFYARIHLSLVDGNEIEFNEKVIEKYFVEKKLEEEYQQFLFLAQIAIHELLHTRTFGLVKSKETQELISELGELIFKNTINNLHKFPQ